MSTDNKFKEFTVLDGCTGNPKLIQTKGLPIAYAENVYLIEIAAVEQLKADLDKVNSEYYEMKIAYKERLDKSRDEIKKIHSENETLRDNLAWWQCNPCESLKDQIQQLKSKLEIAKKGLEFYSLSCREEYGQLYNMAPSAEDKSVLVYAQVAIGSTARQALKEINDAEAFAKCEYCKKTIEGHLAEQYKEIEVFCSLKCNQEYEG